MRTYGEEIHLKYDKYQHVTTDVEDGTGDGNRERLLSESSLSKQVRTHRRAVSDPFDTPDMDAPADGLPVDDNGLIEEQQFALPTLQRYPFAETHNRNCWSEPPVDIFQVRGKDYLTDKKKVTAKKYLLRARGCDLFLADKPNCCEMGRLVGALGGTFRQVPSLLIRLTFPWGVLIQYYEIPKHLVGFIREGENPSMNELTPAEQVLARWLSGSDEYRNERLKLISYVPEGPWVVRNMVTGKPAIIGKKLPVKYKYTPRDGHKMDFLECDLDIGNSSATARRIVSVCRRYMGALAVDIGFVIEGKTAAELPEEMMGGIRIHEVDPLKAPTIT